MVCLQVKDALDKAMKGRTVLVIAHRLSTIKSANVICVIKNHKVVTKILNIFVLPILVILIDNLLKDMSRVKNRKCLEKKKNKNVLLTFLNYYFELWFRL